MTVEELTAVSTHSRPKAAGKATAPGWPAEMFQLTAARRRLEGKVMLTINKHPVSTHSRPKAAGDINEEDWEELKQFQLTAARRRLVRAPFAARRGGSVSTHSRPKAAGCCAP